MKNFNLCVGAVSLDTLALCLEYSKVYDYPICIIASRNQVDYNDGYLLPTEKFIQVVKTDVNYDNQRVKIARDHCGPFTKYTDKNLHNSIMECVKSIYCDIKNGFDYIHIDIGKVEKQLQHKTADILFNEALKYNKKILFEYGSEQNTSVNTLDADLVFLEKYRNNIEFLVYPTGSLTKHKQVGNFKLLEIQPIISKIHYNGYKFKEHNCDYLNMEEVKLRKLAKVNSVNIAPQLGYINSKVLLDLIDTRIRNDFYNQVLQTKLYEKWIVGNEISDTVKFCVSAHYMYNTTQCIELIKTIDKKVYYERLRENVFSILDTYRIGLGPS